MVTSSRPELSQLTPVLGRDLKRSRPQLSLVLPAYNEEEKIGEAVKRVDSVAEGLGVEYEIVVVDDGSTDDTRKRMDESADCNGRIRVVGYHRNEGKGFAVREGFKCANGECILFLDSDLEIDADQIRLYVEALQRNDVVVASKWHPESRVEMPWIRKFLSHGFNLLVSALTGMRMRDTQTGLKAVRREATEEVFSKLSVKGYAFDAELMTLCELFDLKVRELPVRLRMTGRFSLRKVWRMLLDLLGITYRLRIVKWYQRQLAPEVDRIV